MSILSMDHIRLQILMDAIARELDYQHVKWGNGKESNRHDLPGWLLIMDKELREALDGWISNEGNILAREELLQVVCVGIQALLEHGVSERDFHEAYSKLMTRFSDDTDTGPHSRYQRAADRANLYYFNTRIHGIWEGAGLPELPLMVRETPVKKVKPSALIATITADDHGLPAKLAEMAGKVVAETFLDGARKKLDDLEREEVLQRLWYDRENHLRFYTNNGTNWFVNDEGLHHFMLLDIKDLDAFRDGTPVIIRWGTDPNAPKFGRYLLRKNGSGDFWAVEDKSPNASRWHYLGNKDGVSWVGNQSGDINIWRPRAIEVEMNAYTPGTRLKLIVANILKQYGQEYGSFAIASLAIEEGHVAVNHVDYSNPRYKMTASDRAYRITIAPGFLQVANIGAVRIPIIPDHLVKII